MKCCIDSYNWTVRKEIKMLQVDIMWQCLQLPSLPSTMLNPLQYRGCSLAVQGHIMLPFLQTFLYISLILIHFPLSTQSSHNSQVKAILRLPQPELEPTLWARRFGEYHLPKGIWDVGMKEEGQNLHAQNLTLHYSICLIYMPQIS